MAKRFTDSGKWDHAWFRKLPPKMKCVWFYLLDKCDHAGVWVADFESLSFHVGEDVSLIDLECVFADKIVKVDADKYVISSFIDFQYGALNPENRVHQSVISRLEKIGANKVLRSPLKGAKDKDKDKDKEKDKERIQQIEKIYADHYPLKKGKSAGIKKIAKEVKTIEDLIDLEMAVTNYAKDCVANQTAPKYIKHFSTFANEWKEWVGYTPPPNHSAPGVFVPQANPAHFKREA